MQCFNDDLLAQRDYNTVSQGITNTRQSLIAVQSASGHCYCEVCVPASGYNAVGCLSRGLATNQLQLELEARA